MAHLIRDAVDLTYGSTLAPPTRAELWDRALSRRRSRLRDGAAESTDHDRYLDEAFTQ